jgi:hypothetical protein
LRPIGRIFCGKLTTIHTTVAAKGYHHFNQKSTRSISFDRFASFHTRHPDFITEDLRIESRIITCEVAKERVKAIASSPERGY